MYEQPDTTAITELRGRVAALRSSAEHHREEAMRSERNADVQHQHHETAVRLADEYDRILAALTASNPADGDGPFAGR